MTIRSSLLALTSPRPLSRTSPAVSPTPLRDLRVAICPTVELRRQRAVTDCGLLDTPRESRFDIIVEMTRDLLGTRSAAFSLIDSSRSWRKSRIEVAGQEVSRVDSLCSAVLEYAAADDAAAVPRRLLAPVVAKEPGLPSSRMLVVPDARIDDRFSRNPHVRGPAGIVSYVGLPIRAANGERIGVLCAFDSRPRILSELSRVLLTELGALLEIEVQRTVQRRHRLGA
ncbi:MAG: GAF domain-containing protein [Microbacteriaceae bacterium]|nr:GAF domain-containing protein [Microbacteriaceae bacterium]